MRYVNSRFTYLLAYLLQGRMYVPKNAYQLLERILVLSQIFGQFPWFFTMHWQICMTKSETKCI